jgi:hypothetical protein
MIALKNGVICKITPVNIQNNFIRGKKMCANTQNSAVFCIFTGAIAAA